MNTLNSIFYECTSCGKTALTKKEVRRQCPNAVLSAENNPLWPCSEVIAEIPPMKGNAIQ